MRIDRHWFGEVIVLLAALAACSGSQSVPPAVGGNTSAMQRARPGAGSWMNPAAKKQRLMYVSDTGTGNVYIYQVSNFSLVGTLEDVQAMGMCVDKANDVWVVNGNGMLEFAHGGTQVIGEFSSGGGFTSSCATDPSSDDVALGTLYYGSAPGSIDICNVTSGCTMYNPHVISFVDFLSYSKDGVLYADGANAGRSGFAMASFSSRKFHRFTLKGGSIAAPGGIVNANGVLSVGDGEATVYQVSTNGTITGTTALSGASGCKQFAITGNRTTQRLTCPNSTGGNITIYKYPAGGEPMQTLTGTFTKPFAVVFSN